MASLRNCLSLRLGPSTVPDPRGARPRTRGDTALAYGRTVFFGPLAHAFLLALRSATSFRTSCAVVSSAPGADDLGGPPDVGQGLCPGAELVGRDLRGLVAEPVGLPGQGGDIGDRLFGAGRRSARRSGPGRRRSRRPGRVPAQAPIRRPRPALGGGGRPRLGRGDLGGPGPLADRRQEGRDLPGQDPRVAGPHRPRGIEAPLGEPDQLTLGAARIEPGEGLVEAARRGLAEDSGRLPI